MVKSFTDTTKLGWISPFFLLSSLGVFGFGFGFGILLLSNITYTTVCRCVRNVYIWLGWNN